MSGYEDFSIVYDRLMDDVDYGALCARVIALCAKYSHSPKLVLDAACGTGSLALELCKNGCEVVGVDCSEEMLTVARNRLDGCDCALLCQDLAELDLYGTVDTAFCTLDGFNHITDLRQLKKAISRISLFTEPGGLLIFDVNTPYKHRRVLGNNTFVYEREDIYLVWQNRLFGDTVEIALDFFVKQDNGWQRYCSEFCERAYGIEQLTAILDKYGYELLEICDFDGGGKLKPTSEKAFFVARKRFEVQ